MLSQKLSQSLLPCASTLRLEAGATIPALKVAKIQWKVSRRVGRSASVFAQVSNVDTINSLVAHSLNEWTSTVELPRRLIP